MVDADLAARAVTADNSPTLAVLAEAFGADILTANGALDRKLLAQRAFVSPEQAARLNAITHPAIIAHMEAQLAQLEAAGEKAVIIDAPLLFEAGMDETCDLTVAVLACEAVRKARIMARDGIDEAAALHRMEVQPNERFYLERAGNIVYNDEDDEQLKNQLSVLLREIARWCE